MKIFAPLRNSGDVLSLIEAGTDEFYCGYIDKDWKEYFGNSIEMNRRSACGADANFTDLQDLKNAITIAHNYGKRIMLALNHHQFTNSQLPYVYKVIDLFDSISGDGVILADFSAIDYAIRKNIYVAVSTDTPVYNIETVNFFCEMGVNRIILSRDISIDTIAQMKKVAKNVEIETFMINGPCKFSDSLCLGLHSTKYGAFCRFLGDCSLSITSIYDEPTINKLYTHFFHDYMNRSCGICAIWKLINIGVDACKVVGRVLPVERIEAEIKLIKENINIAKECNTEDEFLLKLIRPEYVDCKTSDNCFYVNNKYLCIK